MSKPESIKVEPWCEFPRYSYSIFGDDFVHSKLFVLKATVRGARSTVNIKQTVTSKATYSIADEVKLWFDVPYKNHKVYSKIKSGDYIKLHYDFGVNRLKEQSWNFYTGINCTRSLQNLVIKLGANHLSKHCDSDTRLRVDTKDGNYNYEVDNRTIINHNKLTFGLLGVYDISNNVIRKNDLLVRYTHDIKTEVFLRAETNGFRKRSPILNDWRTYFDNFIIDLVHQPNLTTKVGLEATLDVRGTALKEVQIAVEKSLIERRTVIKAKLNHRIDLALSAKFPLWRFEDIATITKGIALSSTNGKDHQLNYGWQLDLNV